jgi:hypothetical protein
MIVFRLFLTEGGKRMDNQIIIKKDSKLKLYVLFSLMIISISLFLFIIIRYTVNLPFKDDWTATLAFLNKYTGTTSIPAKFNLIIDYEFGHRIALIRIVSLIVYKILGIVDFKVINFIGTAAIFLILSCFWASNLKIENSKALYGKLLWFAPIVLLLLQPMYSESLIQAMVSVSTFYTIGFGILSLLILDKKSDENWLWLLFSFAISLLSYFSHREGLSFLISGIILLSVKRQWLKVSIWVILTATAFIFYQNYMTNTNYEYAYNSNLYNYNLNFKTLSASLKYFLIFVGNNFGIVPQSAYFKNLPAVLKAFFDILPLLCGILICGYFILLIIKRYDQKNAFIFSLMAAIFIISIGAGLYRYTIDSPIVSYYRFPTIFLIITIYISLIELVNNPQKRKYIQFGFLLFGIIFSIFAYSFKINTIAEHKRSIVDSFKTYQTTGKGLIHIGWAFSDPEPILKESIAKGIWKIPDKY